LKQNIKKFHYIERVRGKMYKGRKVERKRDNRKSGYKRCLEKVSIHWIFQMVGCEEEVPVSTIIKRTKQSQELS
jgi:hypothetical protein